jgi:hypothetical protein
VDLRHSKKAVSKSILVAEVALIVFVAVVGVALYYSFLPGQTNTQDASVSIQNLTLLSGSPSTHSVAQSCQGDAIIEMDLFNSGSSDVHVSNIVLSSSSLARNASILVTVSNSCLTLSESNPVVAAGSSYLFDGYVDSPLPFGSSYHYLIEFSNGQNFTGVLVAQS